MIDRAEAKKRITKLKNLPTLPGIVVQITRLVENPDTSAGDVARLITQDQVLSAKVLKMANSAFFGRSRQISSITQALVVLGFDVVKFLVLSSFVSDIMQKSMKGLWEHSLGCAAASRVVARRLGRVDADEFFMAGLLHDLGKVVLALEMPEETDKIVAEAAKSGTSFYDAEKRLLGFYHGEVGAWLARRWNLPDSLAEPMIAHHQPERATKAPLVTAAVHLGDILVRAVGHGFGGDVFVPPLSETAWKILGLAPGDFDGLLDDLLPDLEQTAALG